MCWTNVKLNNFAIATQQFDNLQLKRSDNEGNSGAMFDNFMFFCKHANETLIHQIMKSWALSNACIFFELILYNLQVCLICLSGGL